MMATVETAREDGFTEPSSARGAKRSESGIAGQSDVFEAGALPQVMKIIGAVVAPTTLLTALMYYFGRLQAAAFLWYLGAPVTVMDLTVQDYLNNSVDGMIPALIAGAGAALLALWVHQLLVGSLSADTRRLVLRVLLPVAALAGLVLVGLAIPVFPAFPEARGLSLSVGVLLLFYTARLVRLRIAQRRPDQVPRRAPAGMAVAEWGAAFVLVSVGLFWAVGSYAVGAGIGRAQLLESSLPSRSDVVVYSEKRLSLQAPGIREVSCQFSDAAYRFRYEGLKLVQQSGNQYLFLPAGWTHANGAAILLPRSEALRLEFSPAGQARGATC